MSAKCNEIYVKHHQVGKMLLNVCLLFFFLLNGLEHLLQCQDKDPIDL